MSYDRFKQKISAGDSTRVSGCVESGLNAFRYSFFLHFPPWRYPFATGISDNLDKIAQSSGLAKELMKGIKKLRIPIQRFRSTGKGACGGAELNADAAAL